MLPALHYFSKWTLFLGMLYVASYLVLSLPGTYGAMSYGAGGPKFYCWYPKGFHFHHARGKALTVFYYPLWRFDNTLWHSPRHLRSGAYPVFEGYP